MKWVRRSQAHAEWSRPDSARCGGRTLDHRPGLSLFVLFLLFFLFVAFLADLACFAGFLAAIMRAGLLAFRRRRAAFLFLLLGANRSTTDEGKGNAHHDECFDRFHLSPWLFLGRRPRNRPAAGVPPFRGEPCSAIFACRATLPSVSSRLCEKNHKTACG